MHDKNFFFDNLQFQNDSTVPSPSELLSGLAKKRAVKEKDQPVKREGNPGDLPQSPPRLVKGYNHTFTQSSYASRNTYTSFSGADAIVSVVFKGGKPVTIGECQTITYSTYRPTVPVVALGDVRPRGYTRGPRTVAGSIIFTTFDRNVLVAALHQAFAGSDAKCLDWSILPDEIPPFDFHITFANEYGQSARIIIYGAKLTSEGQVMSIEDMITENTAQFLAQDLQVMEPNVLEGR